KACLLHLLPEPGERVAALCRNSGIVAAPHPLVSGHTDETDAAWSKHAIHLTHCTFIRLLAGQLLQHIKTRHQLERLVSKRQVRCRRLGQILSRSLAAKFERLGDEINAD